MSIFQAVMVVLLGNLIFGIISILINYTSGIPSIEWQKGLVYGLFLILLFDILGLIKKCKRYHED